MNAEEENTIQDGEGECLQHEWIRHIETDDTGYALSYYRCQLCGKEVVYLPRLENIFDPR